MTAIALRGMLVTNMTALLTPRSCKSAVDTRIVQELAGSESLAE